MRVLDVLFNVIDIIDMFNVVVGLLDGRDDDSSEGEGDEHHDPAGEVFVQVWGTGGIHAEGTGSARGLNGLVETGKSGEGEWVVGESGHDPVNESLVGGIAKEVCRDRQQPNALEPQKQGTHRKRTRRPFRRNWRPCS